MTSVTKQESSMHGKRAAPKAHATLDWGPCHPSSCHPRPCPGLIQVCVTLALALVFLSLSLSLSGSLTFCLSSHCHCRCH